MSKLGQTVSDRWAEVPCWCWGNLWTCTCSWIEGVLNATPVAFCLCQPEGWIGHGCLWVLWVVISVSEWVPMSLCVSGILLSCSTDWISSGKAAAETFNLSRATHVQISLQQRGRKETQAGGAANNGHSYHPSIVTIC